MSVLGNLGFEAPGGEAGSATGWSVTVVAQYERLALFGDSEVEDFADTSWGLAGYLFRFVELVDSLPALFDLGLTSGQGLEDFYQGWSQNESYATEWAGGDVALFTPAGPEDFAWGTGYTELPGDAEPALVLALDDLREWEGFDYNWGGNEDYGVVMGPSTPASFDGVAAPESMEDFEETYTDRGLSAATNGTLTAAGHALAVGVRVFFLASSAGRLPQGLAEDLPYYVVASTTNTFQVALTPGGVVLTFSDVGVGLFYVRGDPSQYWRLPA